MTIDASLLTYFMNADLVVKGVLILLMTASVLSWTFILQRGFYLKKLRKATHQFERTFSAGGDLSKLYADALQGKKEGVEALFTAGFKEFLRLRKITEMTPATLVEGVKRAMRVVGMREQDNLEMHLPFLATVGSISPYVGLFGTVWGIMISFRSLASVQQATVSMVAPGIAEALIATAMGLFAAIPAVIAYNRYSAEMGRLLNRFDAFQEEFVNILFHHAEHK